MGAMEKLGKDNFFCKAEKNNFLSVKMHSSLTKRPISPEFQIYQKKME